MTEDILLSLYTSLLFDPPYLEFEIESMSDDERICLERDVLRARLITGDSSLTLEDFLEIEHRATIAEREALKRRAVALAAEIRASSALPARLVHDLLDIVDQLDGGTP